MKKIIDNFMFDHSPKGHLKYEFMTNNGVHFLRMWPIDRDGHKFCAIAIVFGCF